MKEYCRRCDHKWTTKKDTKPKVCPRCKSKLWESDKELPSFKSGRVYVALLKDNKIVVGQTTAGQRRFGNYTGVIDYTLSPLVSSLCKEEGKLIKEAIRLCGKPVKGRELFSGGKGKYKSLILYVSSLKETGDLNSEDIETFDFSKMACMMAIEKNLPFVSHIERVRLAERTDFFIAITEAYSDFKSGSCSADTAFKSLLSICEQMKSIAVSKLENISIDSVAGDMDEAINKICS